MEAGVGVEGGGTVEVGKQGAGEMATATIRSTPDRIITGPRHMVMSAVDQVSGDTADPEEEVTLIETTGLSLPTHIRIDLSISPKHQPIIMATLEGTQVAEAMEGMLRVAMVQGGIIPIMQATETDIRLRRHHRTVTVLTVIMARMDMEVMGVTEAYLLTLFPQGEELITMLIPVVVEGEVGEVLNHPSCILYHLICIPDYS